MFLFRIFTVFVFNAAYLSGLLFSSLIGLLFLRDGPKFVFVKMMDESVRLLRSSDSRAVLNDGFLAVVVQHVEQLGGGVVGDVFALRARVADHGNLFGAGCRA